MSSLDADANQWSALLRKAAGEIRAYPPEPPAAPSFFIHLAATVERLAALPPGDPLEGGIHGAARAIIDCGPLSGAFAPSFAAVHDALQRLERNRRRQAPGHGLDGAGPGGGSEKGK